MSITDRYDDGVVQLALGDCRKLLRAMAPGSVQTVVTSPPYWGLRDYGIAPTVWDEGTACEHEWGEPALSIANKRGNRPGDLSTSSLTNPQRQDTVARVDVAGRFCRCNVPEHVHNFDPVVGTSRRHPRAAGIEGPASSDGVVGRGNRPDTLLSGSCGCGAWQGSLGLEPTPELYVRHLVEIFREVWRVLRDDGTVWLNLGDSYAGSGGAHADHTNDGISNSVERMKTFGKHSRVAGSFVDHVDERGRPHPGPGLKPKDLVGIPWRVAFALQTDGMADVAGAMATDRAIRAIEDEYQDESPPRRVMDALHRLHDEYAAAKGESWWLRCDVIWAKPNPMPESVLDRPTKGHEYLFLLSKRETYYYDTYAIRERGTPQSGRALSFDRETREPLVPGQSARQHRLGRSSGNRVDRGGSGRNRRSVWEIVTVAMGWEYCGCGRVYQADEYRRLRGGSVKRCTREIAKNERCGSTSWDHLTCTSCGHKYTVVEHSKLPYAPRCRACGQDNAWGSHFATYPPELVKPCVLAGTSAHGACPSCGAPWERVLAEKTAEVRAPSGWDTGMGAHDGLAGNYNGKNAGAAERTKSQRLLQNLAKRRAAGGDHDNPFEVKEAGWRPGCKCGRTDVIPCVVLDPFAGSATTLMVAKELGRRAVGFEMSPAYFGLAGKRLASVSAAMALTT